MRNPSQIQEAIEAGTDPEELLKQYLEKKYKIEFPQQRQPGSIRAPRLR